MSRRVCWAVALLAWVAACSPAVSDIALAERIAAAKPDWQSYQEDVKSQVGAAPIAQWQGEPVRARHQGGVVHLTFAMQGAWAGRDVAVPILMRHPLGQVHQNISAQRQGTEVTYEFSVPQTDAPFAWVEIKFPNGARRISLKHDGSWGN